MAKPRFPLPPLVASEREQLQQWTRRSKSAQALAVKTASLPCPLHTHFGQLA